MICSKCGLPQGTHGIDGGTGMCWSCRAKRTAATHEAHPLCAAGPWNYDMDAAPKDGTRVLLAWEYEGEVHLDTFFYEDDSESSYKWWSGGDFLAATEPFAWAAINLPEFKK